MCRRYGIHKKCCYHRPYPKGIPLNCSQEHIEFIRENAWGKSKPVLADLFNKHFGTAISAERMQQICRTLNISSGITQGKGHGRPDGYEFISYGRIFVKVTANKWKEKQRAVWEAANGPVPKGHKIMFADGNNLNCNLDNLLLVSDRERTTMYHHNLRSPDPEMTKIGKDIAKLRIAISDSLKEKKHRRKSRDRRSL
jgi:hypothetical protein